MDRYEKANYWMEDGHYTQPVNEETIIQLKESLNITETVDAATMYNNIMAQTASVGMNKLRKQLDELIELTHQVLKNTQSSIVAKVDMIRKAGLIAGVKGKVAMEKERTKMQKELANEKAKENETMQELNVLNKVKKMMGKK